MSSSQHIEQLSFKMDLPGGERVRFRVEAEVEQHNPESTLVYDTLSHALKKKLKKSEFSRIESLIKKLDWHIDLIHRDRQIKKEIRELVASGMKTYRAVEQVARKHFISVDHAYTIHYGKQSGYSG